MRHHGLELLDQLQVRAMEGDTTLGDIHDRICVNSVPIMARSAEAESPVREQSSYIGPLRPCSQLGDSGLYHNTVKNF